jgi:predicted HNH restriction endonuclease
VPINLKNYPSNWKDISWQVRCRGGWRCEICDAEHGKPHPVTGSKVVLTVHHLDFNVKNNLEYNLISVCQRCHHRLDKRWRAWKRRQK